jgi:dTDP-4-amino-4,6-dideoxygalactose transaminase
MSLHIPFHKSYTTDEDIAQVIEAIQSGWLTMGPKTVEFENEFKKAVKATHAIAVNSCTAALHLALKVIGLKENDEVIIPAMTFTATGEVIRYFNAIPVMIDVDRDTHNILPDAIERAVTPKTRAVIPVHFGGQPADMDEIMSVARKFNLYVIEDAAHCFPSFYKNRPIGNIGDITAFSFYATKTIACGEGGMATTENKEYAENMRIQRLHGISKDAWKRYTKEGSWYYEVVDAGYKYNMSDLQAALGLSQLGKAELMWKKRKNIASTYSHTFLQSPHIQIPIEKNDRISSWHLYVIKLKLETLTISRNEFIEKLSEKNIITSVHFIPLYRHPYYKNICPVNLNNFPNSEWLYERIVSLPIYPGMTEEEIDYVIDNILTITKKHAR